MTHRVLALLLVAFALVLVTGVVAVADEKVGTHEGTVVRAGDGKLVMTDKAGKNEHTHMVPADAKISCDGKDCKLDDIKKGYTVKVTVEAKGGKNQVTKVEAKKA
jgi:hypothetical protein